MVSFKKKELTARASVGARLATRREQFDLTVEQAARGCKVQTRYLQALESGDFAQLPGDVYAKSFLRAYGKFLKLPVQELVRQYTSERTLFKKTQGKPFIEFDRPVVKVPLVHLLPTHKIIRSVSIGMLVLVVVGYLGTRVQKIVEPPSLELFSPSQDMVTSKTSLTVEGVTEQAVSLAINGQVVVATADGTFSEIVDLKPGLNTIEVKAQKKHSRSASITRQVVMIEPE